MKIIYLKFLLLITEISSYIIPNIYNQWFCLDYISNIDKTKPFKSNIGYLPLISWFNNNTSCSTINICSHLGSRLDVGKIENGCLKCPYHGLKYNENMTFGTSAARRVLLFFLFQVHAYHEFIQFLDRISTISTFNQIAQQISIHA